MPEKTTKQLLHWGIAVVWAGTLVAVVISTRIHPPTTLAASLNVRNFSFQTNASRILGPSNDDELLVSQIKSVQIHLSAPQSLPWSAPGRKSSAIDISGDTLASCSFYQVRSDVFHLQGESVLTLNWDPATATTMPGAKSFSLTVHGLLSGNITSQAAAGKLVPGFTCHRVRVDGGPTTDIEARLSPGGGDAISIVTSTDARLDFDISPQSNIGDTQIPIRGEVRLWEVEPGTEHAKAVFLGSDNKVTFERVNQSFPLDEADLLLVVPENDFYLRRFTIKDGIQLGLHGIVRQVRSGAGPKDMQTRMPTLFDQIDNTKRFWGVVPALVAFILGLFDKLRRTPEKQ